MNYQLQPPRPLKKKRKEKRSNSPLSPPPSKKKKKKKKKNSYPHASTRRLGSLLQAKCRHIRYLSDKVPEPQAERNVSGVHPACSRWRPIGGRGDCRHLAVQVSVPARWCTRAWDEPCLAGSPVTGTAADLRGLQCRN